MIMHVGHKFVLENEHWTHNFSIGDEIELVSLATDIWGIAEPAGNFRRLSDGVVQTIVLRNL